MIARLHRLTNDKLWLGMIAYEQTGSLLGVVTMLAADIAARSGSALRKVRS